MQVVKVVFPMTIFQQQWMSFVISFIFLVIVLSAPINASSDLSSSLPIYHVTTFEYAELIQNQYNRDYFEKTLETTGLMAIRVPISTNMNNNHVNDSSNFAVHTQQTLCQCSDKIDSSNISGADQIILKDGLTIRSTIATATQGIDSPLELPSHEIQQVCGTPLKSLNKVDAVEDMEEVRDLVSHIVSKAFLPALDHSLRMNQPQTNSPPPPLLTTKLGMEYNSVADIVKDATHLEHFHIYDKTTDNIDSSIDTRIHPHINEHNAVPIDPALDWHTDAGLFLAFLPGTSCHDGPTSLNNNEDDNNDSFRILKPEANNRNMGGGVEMSVQFPKANPGEVIVAIMLGAGAEHWLYPNSKHDDNNDTTFQLRATRHAVKMRQGDKRVWYGKMYLVPSQSIVQTIPNKKTFSEMRNSVAIHSSQRRYGDQSNNKHDDDVSIGCGFHSDERSISPTIVQKSQTQLDQRSRRRRLQHGVDPSNCSNNVNGVDFYCWMQCLLLKEDEGSKFDSNSNSNGNSVEHHVNQGESLYCAHLETLAVTKDIQQAIDVCTDDRGIVGGSMDAGCSNVWFPTVQGAFTYLRVEQDDVSSSSLSLLDEKYCYGSTSMYMQGFEWEGSTCVVYLFQSWTITTRAAFIGACVGTVLFGILVEWVIKQRRLLVEQQTIPSKKMLISMSLYGVQLIMGYLIMLVVMTYSGPLVLSVVLGLMCGHVLTNWKGVFGGEDENTAGIDLSSGATPCCVAEKKLEKEQKVMNGIQNPQSTTNGSTEKKEKTMENFCCHDVDI